MDAGWKQKVEEIIDRALAEDCAWGDVTTQALVPPDVTGRSSFVAKSPGVLAGVEVAGLVFHRIDPSLRFQGLLSDGAGLQRGTEIAVIEGRVVGILQGERVALNFLQRLSGIATETSRYAEAIRGSRARIVDTRKTTPGLRLLEKYAVRVGGGHNHRMHLGDGILIKDNHLVALRSRGTDLKQALALARKNAPHTLKIEVEVTTPEDAADAADAGADIVMLDNMGLAEVRRAVGLVKRRVLLEASGGITLDNVRAVAETGIDLISIGALTHSVRAIDISLELGS